MPARKRTEQMSDFSEFILQYENDDTDRLLLNREKYSGIDITIAVNTILCRRKLKAKVPLFYSEPSLIYPLRLSAEQCSSEETARYKTQLIQSILSENISHEKLRIADLTGGLGVDCAAFAAIADKVLYNEMNRELAEAARHNFKILGLDNIMVCNKMLVPQGNPETDAAPSGMLSGMEAPPEEQPAGIEASPEELLSGFRPDIVFLDPARRTGDGRKVFLIEECVPDVLALRDGIFIHSRHILLKLSPMADISMAASRLGSTCREIHVVSCGGECKELLIWMDREWQGEYSVTACELHGSGNGIFTFRADEEKNAVPAIAARNVFERPGFLLFEPGKSLMKAGAFNLLSERYGLRKLARSTHYYIMEDCGMPDETGAPEKSAGRKMSGGPPLSAGLGKMGKFFRVTSGMPLDKRSVKEAGAAFPNADVTARNIRMDTETLRKKLSANAPRASMPSKDLSRMQKSGIVQEKQPAGKPEHIHIFGLKSDTAGDLLITAIRLERQM